MSTNFYVKLHLGKRSSQGATKPMLFMLANSGYHELLAIPGAVVVDETGLEINPSAFLDHLLKLDFNYSHVGEEFS